MNASNLALATPAPRNFSRLNYTQNQTLDRARYRKHGPVGWRLPRTRQTRSEHCHDHLTTYSMTAGLLFTSVHFAPSDPRDNLEVRPLQNRTRAGEGHMQPVEPEARIRTSAQERPQRKCQVLENLEDEDVWMSLPPNRMGWISMKPLRQ